VANVGSSSNIKPIHDRFLDALRAGAAGVTVGGAVGAKIGGQKAMATFGLASGV
jgi:hypothetical protein